MAANQVTPVDEIGMPLPIVPPDQIRLIERYPHESDWHHHFHPRRSPILTANLGGQAVRHARLQLTDWDDHHNAYHGYYEGPTLPVTQSEQFGIVVLACAGYVPNEGIDFSSGEPRRITLSELHRKRLWTEKELKVGAPETVRKFLMEYTLNQDISDAGDLVIDEFLTTSNKERRYELGGVLLKLAIDKATEPLNPFYRNAWQQGNIDRKSSLRPQRFLKNKIAHKKHGIRLIKQLHERLAI